MGNRTPPLVMGHEFAGTVVEVGEGVNENLVGRTVAVNPLSSDGTCRLCRAGLANLCSDRTLIDIHHPGGFAELARAPVANVYPLPEGFSGGARVGALAELLANGVHAVRLRGPGEAVEHTVVIGAGTIGLMCLQAAVLGGIPNVAVVEPHEARREQALGLGAHAAYSSGAECREALEEHTEGLGPDLVIDAVGAKATRRMAIEELVRPGGRVVMVGLHDDATTLGFHGVVRGQISIQGSYAYTARDYEQALEWLVDGRAGIGELPPVLVTCLVFSGLMHLDVLSDVAGNETIVHGLLECLTQEGQQELYGPRRKPGLQFGGAELSDVVRGQGLELVSSQGWD
uniref:Threonine dehydrogenase and related Zn-dependent dehydrogenases n=1 Tax=uncultured Rubrobacteraceae bacterium TaxID=349277 RepID=A0A6J4Q6L2_9ACTN|nr:MAG: Threonine dehydrogenase and related Zn-dependent dehydrogenases [uncultured Rubrobacteraceae bacterium]